MNAHRRFLAGLTFLFVAFGSSPVNAVEDACERFVAEVHETFPSGTPDDPFRINKIDCGEFGTMYDSGSGLMGGALTFWIDSRTVVFPGKNGRPYPSNRRERRKPAPVENFVWELGRGIERVDRFENKGIVRCIAREFASLHAGPAFDEKKKLIGSYIVEVEGTDESRRLFTTGDRLGRWNPFQCRYLPPRPDLKDRVWVPLAPGDGYLDLGLRKNLASQYGRPLRLVNPERSIDMALPIAIRDFGSTCVRYFDFKGAYFLFNCITNDGANWRRRNCLAFWWLWPDGRTEKGCIPAGGPWTDGPDFFVVPLREGFFIASKKHRSLSDPGEAGAYLARDGRVVRLVQGDIEFELSAGYTDLSPDGCRVAFGHSPSLRAGALDGPGPRTARIMDFCETSSTSRAESGG